MPQEAAPRPGTLSGPSLAQVAALGPLYAVLRYAPALRVTRPARCGSVAVKAESRSTGRAQGQETADHVDDHAGSTKESGRDENRRNAVRRRPRPIRPWRRWCGRAWITSRESRMVAGASTGVAPFVTTCFGPRTAAAGFTGRTWLTTSQSPSMRRAARCCLTVGADPGWVQM